jgi:hypothetical protein
VPWLISFSLDLVRFRSIHLCLLILSAGVVVRGGDVVSEYQAVTGQMTERAIESALFKEPSRWNRVSMKFRFNVTDDGRIRDVKITSRIRNRWAEDTARRALLAIRLPPVPKEVLKLVGHNGLYTSAELEIGK